MDRALLMIVVVAAAVTAESGQKTSYWEQEQELRNKLLQGYRSDVKPSLQTEVEVKSINLNYINLREDRGMLEVNSFFPMEWHDPRLSWNPEEYKDISTLAVSPSSLWTPDLTLYNSGASNQRLVIISDQYHALVYPNGTVLVVPSIRLSFPCSGDLTLWPSDKANCSIKVGSWVYSKGNLDLKLTGQPIVETPEVEGGEWRLQGAAAELEEHKYDCCPEEYVNLLYSFTLMRCAPAFLWTVKAPFICLTVLSLVVFLVPARQVETKLTFGGLLVVAHVVFLVHLSSAVVRAPTTTPLIVRVEAVELAVVTAAMVLSGLVAILTHSPRSRAPHSLLRGLASCLAHVLCIKPSSDKDPGESGHPLKSEEARGGSGEAGGDCGMLAGALNRLGLVVCAPLAFILVTLILTVV